MSGTGVGEDEKVAAYARRRRSQKKNEEIKRAVEAAAGAQGLVFSDDDTAITGIGPGDVDAFQLQQEHIVLLAAIGMQLRRIYCAQLLQAAGKGAESLMHLCGMGRLTRPKRRSE